MLCVRKSDVNRILYSGEGRLFHWNADYRWSFIDGVPSPEVSPMDVPMSTNRPFGGDEVASRCARATLARLKRGIPPAMNISQLAVGMERLEDRLESLLQRDVRSRWLAVTGEYGEGKSFFRALASERALAAGYAVASFDVNKDEGALHQPQRHLAVLLNSLQSPLAELQNHQGLLDVFRHWLAVCSANDLATVLAQLGNVSPPLPNTREHEQVTCLIEEVLNANAFEFLLDETGCKYRKAATTGFVYRSAPGSSDWYYFGQEDVWADLQSRCRVSQSNSATADLAKSPQLFGSSD